VYATTQEQHLSETSTHLTITGSKVRIFCVVLFFIALACTYVQWFVHGYRSFKMEDSGIFLHVAQRVIHGDVLYRDIADNKPPLIYWINALGLLLGRGSPGGVLFLSLISGILTFAILYFGLRRYVPWQLFIVAACLSQLAFVTCAFHPNYTESFALPLVALAGVLFVRDFLDGEEIKWYTPAAQGAIATLLFCLRANNIGISTIYFLYLLFQLRKGARFRQLGSFALGAAVVYGLVLLPLAVQGIVPDYVTNVFRLAAPYTFGTTAVARLRAFWHGLVLLGESPLLYFTLACVATVIVSQRASRRTRLLLWLVAWLAIEMVLSSTSGYHWEHYYLLWIPPLALMLMLAGSALFTSGLNPVLPVALALSLIVVVVHDSVIRTHEAVSYGRSEDPAVALARTYIRSNDRITTWGHFHHDLWFDLDHRPGTRWFHEGAFTNRKIYQALMPSFLSDLEKNRPRIVIERRCVVPLFAPPDPDEPLNDAFVATYFEGWDDASLTKRKKALARLYQPVAEKSGIVVYVRRD
jgi:hypothetical protein